MDMYAFYLPGFHALLEEVFADPPLAQAAASTTACKKHFATLDTIPISRVIYSGNSTTVFFTDGTKTTVKCSETDNYDRQTAIVYALVKRLFGKVGRYDAKTKKFYADEIDGNGLGTKLEKIAAAGFDQDEEKRTAAARKAKAQQEHAARQKRESEAAWKKKVAKKAEELRLERDAEALLAGAKKPLNESTELPMPSSTQFFGTDNEKSVLTEYTRPNKPFSKFTAKEKREYWRFHNAKRRASK